LPDPTIFFSVSLSERYDVPLRTSTRADMAPDEAILREAGRGSPLPYEITARHSLFSLVWRESALD
jgi:hypothetical protein